ncbi:MAG: leucine-rich repeat protein [Clostridia bacterium]|nr:leucine-rich repeat protein [Clostridia bacterium]
MPLQVFFTYAIMLICLFILSVGAKGEQGETNVVIPTEYNNIPVKGISANAFYERDDLMSLTIPDSITSIGNEAFVLCRNLSRSEISIFCITILNSVKRYYYSETKYLRRYSRKFCVNTTDCRWTVTPI